jgi:Acetyltransferase (GNAT) domain
MISDLFSEPTARVSSRFSARFEANIVDPTSDADWDQLVISHPHSTVFHSSAWARVLSKTYGHKPISLLLCQSGEPIALVPLLEVSSPFTGRRGVSLPFTDFCDPLFFSGCDSNTVLKLLCELAGSRQWRYFEIRAGNAAAFRATPSVKFYGHRLDLRSGPEALFARFSGSVRRAIRKAQRSGVTIEIQQSEDSTREFYDIHSRTRRRHGLPPQPLSFFLNIHDLIIRSGLGFVILAKHGDRSIAGAVFLHKSNKAVYKFGASDERAQHLRANNLVFWEAIQLLAQQGFEELHFGRTSLENEGLRRFKISWRPAEETIEYFRFCPASGECKLTRDKVSGFYNGIFARSPLAFNRLVGRIIYPHLD